MNRSNFEEEKNNKQINYGIKESLINFYLENAERCMELLQQGDDPNIDDIYKYIDGISKADLEKWFEDTEILILTANKYETNILHKNIYEKYLKKENKLIHKVLVSEFNGTHYFYFFTWGRYNIVHIMADSTGSNTVGGSEDMIRLAFRYKMFRPLAVVSFGICFGIDYIKQTLGNVIISEKVYSYGEGLKFKENKVEISDNNNFSIDGTLLRSFRELRKLNIISEAEGEYIGNYITGEAVMSNESLKQEIVRGVTTQQVMAGEMEGYGMFKECTCYERQGNGVLRVPCVIIKSICDWGAQKNGFLDTLCYEQSEREVESQIMIAEKCKKMYLKLKGGKNIDLRMIEDDIKNSIQAFAVWKAFQTCDKVFSYNKYAMGEKPFKWVSMYVSNYIVKKHSLCIWKDTLVNEIKERFPYISQEEINEVIERLTRGNILKYDQTNGLYTIREKAGMK